jgi:shikimate dehydrogenase
LGSSVISGNTKVYGVIADPIGHVMAPTFFNRLFAERGIDAVLVPFHVPPVALQRAVAGFRALANLGGYAVTNPHKVAMFHLCDEVDVHGTRLQAVNVVRRTEDGRLVGGNYDGAGFILGLRADGHEVRGKRVLMLGAGGAGRAIAFALSEAGVAELAIANRTRANADALVRQVETFFPATPVRLAEPRADGYDIAINTTSVGLAPGDPLPLDVRGLKPSTLVADIIMKPEMTKLLIAARDRGCPIHLGKHMLDSQLALLARHLGIPV